MRIRRQIRSLTDTMMLLSASLDVACETELVFGDLWIQFFTIAMPAVPLPLFSPLYSHSV